MGKHDAGQTLRLGLTMGDPSGIGPEVILKALSGQGIPNNTDLILFGNPFFFNSLRDLLGIPVSVEGQGKTTRLHIADKSFVVIDPTDWQHQRAIPGISSRAQGSLHCISEAVQWAQQGKIQAIVTAPINKEVIRKGGFPDFTGHTEYLAHLTDRKRPVMMLATDKLRVVMVTTHIPFKDIVAALTLELILDTINQTRTWYERFYQRSPMIAVAGLNPHAGEGGAIGMEETKLLLPAILMAQQKGINVQGPYSPDTIFRRALQGEWDVVVALYHDQGMIPIKLDATSIAVNITVGLPIIRTSVDHGTAYDISGKGIARPESLIKAIEWARDLAQRKIETA